MSLGLPYIRQIFQSEGARRRELYVRYVKQSVIAHVGWWSFLTRALECLGKNPAQEAVITISDEDDSCVLAARQEEELGVPPAWSWANTLGPPVDLHYFDEKGLRDWGYLFWDGEPLVKSGILDKDSNTILLTCFGEYEANNGPSVQERLLKPESIWYLGCDQEIEVEPWEDWSEDL